MGDLSKRLGSFGENIAVNYLKNIGYKVLERNFRSSQGEVDIIAEDGGFLVFLEIKNYSFRSFSSPIFAIRKSKRESIIHAARYYLYKKNIRERSCRFDVLTIYWEANGERRIELIKDAFRVN